MIAAQANDHLAMSRELSQRQRERDRERMEEDQERFFESGYARAMELDVARAIGGVDDREPEPESSHRLDRRAPRRI